MTVKKNETAVNVLLAGALRMQHPRWRDSIHAEQAGILQNASRQPDIIVDTLGVSPVAIETEFSPARTVEADTRARLGELLTTSGKTIEQAIAVRLPKALAEDQGSLRRNIDTITLEYITLSGTRDKNTRWPTTGWLTGGIDDLARTIETMALSEQLIARGLDALAEGVEQCAALIGADTNAGFDVTAKTIAVALNQQAGDQTTKMGMAVLANAFNFHNAIAGAHNIQAIGELDQHAGTVSQSALLGQWAYILDHVNYWPIFKLASDVLTPIRAKTAQSILTVLTRTAEQLAAVGTTTVHDLSGRMIQRLIEDRKLIATFYTLPTSAALLAELALTTLNPGWDNETVYHRLQIADLACGTGTLLSAAYEAVRSRYRRTGHDDAAIHQQMIEQNIIATDILPIATHLAASQISSAHPTATFGNCRIYTMQYGKTPGHGTAIGTLDLLDGSQIALFPTGGKQIRGRGREVATRNVDIRDGSLDLVIMNPPFTRPTNHKTRTVPIPSFAGFRNSADEQRAMSNRLKKLRSRLPDAVGNGYAGLASDFVDLGHLKVKPGGVLALVIPMAFCQGVSWSRARTLFEKYYTDIRIVSIASSRSTEKAFSADTDMGEVLVVARKRSAEAVSSKRQSRRSNTTYVNLRRRPRTLMEATETAKVITEHGVAGCESGHIRLGNETAGIFMAGSIHDGGRAGVRHIDVANTAAALHEGELRLPGTTGRIWPIPIAKLETLGEPGKVHRLVGSLPTTTDSARPRGPFLINPIRGSVPTYPVLWNHDAERERHIVVEPDAEGQIRPGHEEDAQEVWTTRTRLHLTLDFRLNSQSLAACMTPKPSIGGRAWPNFQLHDRTHERITALWFNSTLGLLSFWWKASRQQSGRAIVTITTLDQLIAPDAAALDADAHKRAFNAFEHFAKQPLRPAHEAARDHVRQDLDRALLIDVLGLTPDVLGSMDVLRRQWTAEPSVHGGKSS